MDRHATLSIWTGGEMVTLDRDAETPLLVADSFLVDSGRVLALELHRKRFRSSALLQGCTDPAMLDQFWTAAVEALPRDGAWFPRFELVRTTGALRPRLRQRPAPALGTELVLASAANDPRLVPDIKGPDIERLTAAQRDAERRGGQEAVILSDGHVVDGATTALVWWRGDVLCAPPLSLPRVDSVAARTVRGIAAALGVPVEEEEVRPAELAGTTVWAVNALHGIREATAWVDGPPLIADRTRTNAWRARFAALARPLPALS